MAEPTTAPLATVADLEAFWRPLNNDEKARADDLINIASARLRVIANNSGKDIDERIANDTTNNYAQVVEWVVLEAVKRALQTPVDSLPVDSYSQTAGPYSENYKYTNPSGDLWFKKKELAEIGISGVQRLASVTPTTRSDIYGE